MGNFLVRYASRVAIYNRRAVIRLATGVAVRSMLRLLGHRILRLWGMDSCTAGL